jgi:hypothetical protein
MPLPFLLPGFPFRLLLSSFGVAGKHGTIEIFRRICRVRQRVGLVFELIRLSSEHIGLLLEDTAFLFKRVVNMRVAVRVLFRCVKIITQYRGRTLVQKRVTSAVMT